MKKVLFTIFGHGTDEDAAIADLKEKVRLLQSSCIENGLELENQYILPAMNSGVYNRNDDYKGGWQSFCKLAIPKIKGTSYPRIYEIVNAVHVCSFRIEGRG